MSGLKGSFLFIEYGSYGNVDDRAKAFKNIGSVA
jgi:hypothetical protein